MRQSELPGDTRMTIIYSATVFTKIDRNRVIPLSIGALTGKYDPLSSNSHLVYQSLLFEGVDNTIEGSEVHPGFSFFSDELFSQI